MQAQFEAMLKELGGASALGGEIGAGSAGAVEGAKPADASSKAGPSAGEDSFQETIKKTMERMQTSGEQATAAAAATDDSNDILAELMKQMQGSGIDGEGNEEDFSKMLLGMMEQLTNKEILYEPMKELDDKFPEWMEKNKSTTSKEDLTRYEQQQLVVREIVARFEAKTYADSNVADREYIVDRMQKVCRYVIRAGSFLTNPRCKQQVRRLQISSARWRLHRKLLGHLMRAVHNNRIKFNLNKSYGFHS
jgi:peroxin-19